MCQFEGMTAHYGMQWSL